MISFKWLTATLTHFLDCEQKGMITMKCLCRETCDSQGSCVEDYKFLDDDGTVSMETYNPCQVKFLLLFYIVKIILQFTDKK